MKQLLEDYQRRLLTIEGEVMAILGLIYTSTNAMEKYKRLGVKASCYRTFITELERAIKAEEQVNY